MSRLRNTRDRYGWVAIAFHWLLAVLIIGLFALGLWMRGLGYYDPWYYRATQLHESLGLLTGLLLVARLVWRLVDAPPRAPGVHKPWERHSAVAVHWLLYALGFAIVVSGVLIAVAGEEPLAFFGAIDLGSYPELIAQQADRAGRWHEWLAWTCMGLVVLHSLAAFKHHFVDRDTTLRRILVPGRDRE